MREWLYPGAKVVCVDARARFSWAPGEALVEGKVYTVRDTHIDDENMVVLRLFEVERSRIAKDMWKDERLGYGAFRFRPLTKRKTSIAIFERMLNSTPETVEAE